MFMDHKTLYLRCRFFPNWPIWPNAIPIKTQQAFFLLCGNGQAESKAKDLEEPKQIWRRTNNVYYLVSRYKTTVIKAAWSWYKNSQINELDFSKMINICSSKEYVKKTKKQTRPWKKIIANIYPTWWSPHNFVNTIRATKLCILNRWTLWYVNYISIKL